MKRTFQLADKEQPTFRIPPGIRLYWLRQTVALFGFYNKFSDKDRNGVMNTDLNLAHESVNT